MFEVRALAETRPSTRLEISRAVKLATDVMGARAGLHANSGCALYWKGGVQADQGIATLGPPSRELFLEVIGQPQSKSQTIHGGSRIYEVESPLLG